MIDGLPYRNTMEPETLGIVGMLLITFGLLYFIMRMRSKNIEVSTSQNQPIVAGEDEIAGAAINPSQFDEPDDATLDMLGEMLEEAAEAQGLVYEE